MHRNFFLIAAAGISFSATIALSAAASVDECDRECDADVQRCYQDYTPSTNLGFECLIEEADGKDYDACIRRLQNNHYQQHIQTCNVVHVGCLADCVTDPVGDSGGWDTGTGGGGGDTGFFYGGPSFGGPLGGLVHEECPDGTTADPLGLCVPYLTSSAPEDSDPDDGCGAGFVRGSDDGPCVPEISLAPVDVFSPDGEVWWMTCQPPLVPGPAGGCAVDTSGTSTTEDAEVSCAPPLVPGPDDRCVPDLSTQTGRALAAKFVVQLTDAGIAQDEAVVELLASYGVAPVEDVAEAVAAVKELSWD